MRPASYRIRARVNGEKESIATINDKIFKAFSKGDKIIFNLKNFIEFALALQAG